MDLDDNETRLLLCLEALCDSLFRDDEWAEFRRDCCELDVEQWHSLNSVLGEELGDIWDDMSLEAPSLWLRISLTPCGRWRICAISTAPNLQPSWRPPCSAFLTLTNQHFIECLSRLTFFQD